MPTLPTRFLRFLYYLHTMRKIVFSLLLLLSLSPARASNLLIPMDDSQTDHLKGF